MKCTNVFCFLSYVDRMMADVRDEKWDVIKVVCRQPYNRNMQYGLSFLNVKGTSPDADGHEASVVTKSPSSSNQNTLKSFFGFTNNKYDFLVCLSICTYGRFLGFADPWYSKQTYFPLFYSNKDLVYKSFL